MKYLELLEYTTPPPTPTDENYPDFYQFANLVFENTGIDGCIYVSSHNSKVPRVRYSKKPGDKNFCVISIIDHTIMANNLDNNFLKNNIANVLYYLDINRQKLLTIWNEGDTWDYKNFSKFVKTMEQI